MGNLTEKDMMGLRENIVLKNGVLLAEDGNKTKKCEDILKQINALITFIEMELNK